MRLYRMELYKLCHRKIFLVCGIITLLMTVLFFCMAGLGEQRTVINGTVYDGYEAVRMERQIMEKYRGELTDEKVAQIVGEYGLPSEVMYGYGGWRDANCLNNFVTEYLSDGYLRSWDNYQIPTKVHAIADTDLGKLQEITGEPVELAYTRGWKCFLDLLQIDMFLASILLLMGISVIFAEESQAKMLPLLCTTAEGKEKDLYAKIAAGFTLTILVYVIIVLLNLVMCLCVFGLDGGGCPRCIALSRQIIPRDAVSYMPVASFTWFMLGVDLLAMLLLCAITMCVSAHCKSNFGAVTMAAILWGIPMLIRIFFNGLGFFITSCMPIFVIMTDTVYDLMSWRRGVSMIVVDVVMFLICVNEGYGVYKRRCE